jgi:predicted ATPase/transcriptional regulator with XRE-family HTH domain
MEEVYSFGYWVMRRRKALDLTRAGLALQVSCSPETIKKIERDERRPSRQMAELLAAALAVPVAEHDRFLRAALGEGSVDRLTVTDEPLDQKPRPGKTATERPASGRPVHNLPYHPSRFIGREREIAEVGQLIIRSRLVTLTGVGGGGKTRLAREAAGPLLESFPDGIWLVELAPLSDPALAASFIAATLGLINDPDRSPLDTMVEYLRDQQLLLLLDNCEHLIETMARLIETLVHRCPDLHILTTSRERLEIDGEAVWLVPPLALPPENGDLSIAELTGHDSIRLFVERATAALPTFALTEQNAAAVAQLCRRLDGIPMALELAAARVRILRVEEIVARLDDRFRLLTGGNRAAPPRHQTLRALIDWSYDLLPPVEQRLLRRLSVFAGGFSLEEVEAICDEECDGNVLDLLTQLVNKSLVVADRVSGERTRYTLHETIRQYGLERLAEDGAVERTRDRHAAFYCRLAEEAEPQLYEATQIYWLDQLDEKYDNLRAALNWTLVEHLTNAETGLRLAAALAYYWEMRGILLEGQRWLSAALEQVNSAAVPLRASFYLNAGNFWLEHGYWGGSKANLCARESLSLYSRLEDKRGIAWTLRLLGNCALYYEQDFERAASLLEQCLAMAEELNDTGLLARAYQNLGRTMMFWGNLPKAAILGEKGLALARETGDRNVIGYLSFHAGLTAARQEDYARAEAHLLEALAVCRELKLKLNATKTLNPLGEVARLQEKYDQAASYYQEYLTVAAEIAGFEDVSIPLSNLGWIAIMQGDLPRAVDFFRQSIENDKFMNAIPWNLWGLALVAATQGRMRQAVQLYAVFDKLLESDSVHIAYRKDREAYRDHLASVRGASDEHEFSAAWAEGQHMSVEEAIAYALEEGA